MRLIIAKVDEIYFDGEAKSLTVPGAEGEMTVLGHHEPIITILKPGAILVRTETPAGEQKFDIAGGILEVHQGGATVIL